MSVTNSTTPGLLPGGRSFFRSIPNPFFSRANERQRKNFGLILSSVCLFPPTFDGLLDFSVLPFNVVHGLVLLFLLLSLLELLLLPLLSVSLLCLVLAGVLCGGREGRFQASRGPSRAALTQSVNMLSVNITPQTWPRTPFSGWSV